MTRSITALTLLLLTGSGCAMIGSVQTARTVGEGNFQFAVEPSAWGAASPDGGGALVGFNIAGRYGVSDRFDLGGRVGTTGAQLMGKVMFTDPEADGVRLALAPAGGGFGLAAGGAGFGMLTLQVPLLIGVPVGEHSELTLGPRVHNILIVGGGGGEAAGANFLLGGLSVGFAGALGPNFRLMPELTVEYPIVASAGATGAGGATELIGGDAIIWAFNLGFLVGGR